jgi:hypothetical protein
MSALGFDIYIRHKTHSGIRWSAGIYEAQVVPRSGNLRQPFGEVPDDTRGFRREVGVLPVEHEETSAVRPPDGQQTSSRNEIGKIYIGAKAELLDLLHVCQCPGHGCCLLLHLTASTARLTTSNSIRKA